MKAYCLKVVHDFIQRGIIEIKYIGKDDYQPVFYYNNLLPSFYSIYEGNLCKMYIGDGIMMYGIGRRDVISFEKDGNVLSFNIEEVLKEYKEDVLWSLT